MRFYKRNYIYVIVMGGGLIQLVAYGVQDIYLTGDPQITFFKVVYKRHTNFSTEPIRQLFSSQPDFGKKVTCTIARNGDLIHKMYLFVELPFIPPFKLDDGQTLDSLKKFAWVKRIGYALIKEIDVEIGGQIIDRHYGDWLNIWSELTIGAQSGGLSKMIGNVDELIKPSNGKSGYSLYIPLQFWFCKHNGLALPIVSLQYSEIKIHLEINNAESCYIVSPSHSIEINEDVVCFNEGEYIEQNNNDLSVGAVYSDYDTLTKKLYYVKTDGLKTFTTDTLVLDPVSGARVTPEIVGQDTCTAVRPVIEAVEEVQDTRLRSPLTLSCSWLYVDYIYLDTEERIRFSRSSHELLIEQLQFSGSKTLVSNNNLLQLSLNHPTKELIWVAQLNSLRNEPINDLFNYSNHFTSNPKLNRGVNSITRGTLLLNGRKRFIDRDGNYFNWVQPYDYHKRAPSEGIYVYSFGLFPETIQQPSGSCNMSKIDDVKLELEFDGSIRFDNTADFRLYAPNYNILRIVHGLGGIAFT